MAAVFHPWAALRVCGTLGQPSWATSYIRPTPSAGVKLNHPPQARGLRVRGKSARDSVRFFCKYVSMLHCKAAASNRILRRLSACFFRQPAVRLPARQNARIISKMTPISKENVHFVTITAEETGQRLDNYLFKLLKGVPKSHVQRIIRAGEVRLNKKRCHGTDRLGAGDVLRIPPVRIAQKPPAAAAAVPARDFDIVYEDQALLVINKPAGVAVHGGSGVSFGVIEQLRRARPEARYLELVHRLDKDTSGLLMIAKKRSALVKLHEMLRSDHPKKVYLALGVGQWLPENRHVRAPLVKYTGAQGEKMVRVDADGQNAHTVFRLLHHFSGSLLHNIGLSQLSLVEATLKTGRTHQIRVHMQSQHCPIAGDERYGDYTANKRLHKFGLKRMFLHAARLELDHPLSGERLKLEAPLPLELQNILAILQAA